MSNFVDQVLVNQDSRYTIAVTKDHNQGLVVQVARLNPKHVRGDTGAIYDGHAPVVLWQQIIAFGQKSSTGEINFRLVDEIEQDLKTAVLRAQTYAQKCIQLESEIDKLLLKLLPEA